MNFLEMELAATLIIIVAIFLRATGKKILPAEFFCALWGIAIFRIFLPFSRTSALSFQNIMLYFEKPKHMIESTFLSNVVETSSFQMTRLKQTVMTSSAVEPLTVVWIIGSAGFFLFFVILFFRSIHKARSGIIIDTFTMPLFGPFKRRGAVRLVENLDSPAAFGIFQPCIMIPIHFDLTDKERLRLILLHEKTHLRFYHSVWSFFSVLAVCLHWVNPFVWLLYFLFQRDTELFCDRCVLRKLNQTEQKNYAITLTDMAMIQSQSMPLYNNFFRTAICERMEGISRFKKTTLSSALISVFLFLGISTVFLTTNNMILPNKSFDDERKKSMMNTEEIQSTEGKFPSMYLKRDALSPLEKSQSNGALTIQDYGIHSVGAPAEKIVASLEEGGVSYNGVLSLVCYEYHVLNEDYFGYYSGSLYQED